MVAILRDESSSQLGQRTKFPTTLLFTGTLGGTVLGGDLLVAAAQQSGWTAASAEQRRLETSLDGASVLVAVRLATQEALAGAVPSDVAAWNVDFLASERPRDGVAWWPQLRSYGQSIMWDANAADMQSARKRHRALPRLVRDDERLVWLPQVAADTIDAPRRETWLFVLGLLSQRLDISRDAWRSAFEMHLPKRIRQAGWESFELGSLTPVDVKTWASNHRRVI